MEYSPPHACRSRSTDGSFKLSEAEKAEANELVTKSADELKAMYVFLPSAFVCLRPARSGARSDSMCSYDDLLKEERELEEKLKAAA